MRKQKYKRIFNSKTVISYLVEFDKIALYQIVRLKCNEGYFGGSNFIRVL